MKGWDCFIDYYNSHDVLNKNYKLYRFSYQSNVISVAALADELRQALTQADALDPQGFAGKQISIIGHSMGGLIARFYMGEDQQNGKGRGGERVQKLITLDTPHHGPRWQICQRRRRRILT